MIWVQPFRSQNSLQSTIKYPTLTSAQTDNFSDITVCPTYITFRKNFVPEPKALQLPKTSKVLKNLMPKQMKADINCSIEYLQTLRGFASKKFRLKPTSDNLLMVLTNGLGLMRFHCLSKDLKTMNSGKLIRHLHSRLLLKFYCNWCSTCRHSKAIHWWTNSISSRAEMPFPCCILLSLLYMKVTLNKAGNERK